MGKNAAAPECTAHSSSGRTVKLSGGGELPQDLIWHY